MELKIKQLPMDQELIDELKAQIISGDINKFKVDDMIVDVSLDASYKHYHVREYDTERLRDRVESLQPRADRWPEYAGR